MHAWDGRIDEIDGFLILMLIFVFVFVKFGVWCLSYGGYVFLRPLVIMTPGLFSLFKKKKPEMTGIPNC